MTAEKTTMAFGWRVYGLGVMALGMVCLAWGDFDLEQPVPKDFPDRTALAYAITLAVLPPMGLCAPRFDKRFCLRAWHRTRPDPHSSSACPRPRHGRDRYRSLR